jgi:pimeloyl-ACP methyl ester carboxylesterase
MPKKNILCLHGFLGSPQQFDFLKAEYNIFCPDLSTYVELEFDDLKAKLIKQYPGIGEMNILGYSFGSRLGARLFLSLNSSGKFIGLTGHAGLNTESERDERLLFEQSMMRKLEVMDKADFLEEWNSYGIFKYDRTLEIKSVNFKKSELYFRNYGLSKQPYIYQELLNKRNAVFYYYGELDEKYKTYAHNELKGLNVEFLKNKGHRLIDFPEKILEICRKHI